MAIGKSFFSSSAVYGGYLSRVMKVALLGVIRYISPLYDQPISIFAFIHSLAFAAASLSVLNRAQINFRLLSGITASTFFMW